MDLTRLSTDDLMALRAGDLGRVSTQGLQELRRQNAAADPQAKLSARAAAQAEPVDNTMGMGRAELAAAGLGKAFNDVAMSVRQGANWLGNKVGVVSDADYAKLQAELDEQARIDKRLMSNGWAIAGNMGGQLGAALLPVFGQVQAARTADALWKLGGAANILRSLGVAGGLGAAQNVVMNPRTSDDSLLGQAATGGALGALGQGVIAPALGGLTQLGRTLLAGDSGRAGRSIGTAASAGRRPDAAAMRALAEAAQRNNAQIVPGSLPTGVQALDNEGVSQLARVVANRVQGGAMAGRAADQNAARLAYLGSVAPIRGDAITAAEDAGQLVAKEAGERRDMLKAAARQKYDEAAQRGAALALPAKSQAKRVLEKFYPRGPVPGDPHAATLHAFVAGLDSPGPVPLAEFDAMRKQAGNKARALARGMGENDPTAAAAWRAITDLFNEAEKAAVAKSGPLMPTGHGPWGPVYGGLTGDADNAVAHLLRMQTGEVPGALGHRQVKHPIDLIWGHAGTGKSDGAGLAKLNAYHPEALQDLQGLLNRTSVRPEASGANRLRMAGPNGEDAVVSLDWRGDPKTWLLSAFERNPESAGRSMNLPGALGEGAAASTPAALGGSLPDIEASFKAFDRALNPPLPPRDPRQYVGDLLGAMMPDQAAPLQAGRALHAERKARFDTGPARLLFQTGADNLPRAQGAEAARNFFNSGAAQAEAIDSLNRIVLERGPGKRAMQSYAITDLVQSATNKADELSLPKYERWVEQRSQALKGLLDGEQLGKVKAVLLDLKRADRAANAGRATGSNTAQNLAGDSMLGAGLLDALSAKVPYVGPWVAGSMRDAQRTRSAGLLDAILADPTRTAGALDAYAGLLDPNLLQRGLIYTPAVMNPMAGGLLESLRSEPAR